MAEALKHGRWMHRLLLLAAAICGFWLLGLLGSGDRAEAAAPPAGLAHSVPSSVPTPLSSTSSAANVQPLAGLLASTRNSVNSVVRSVSSAGESVTAGVRAGLPIGRPVSTSGSAGSDSGSSTTGSPRPAKTGSKASDHEVVPVVTGLLSSTVETVDAVLTPAVALTTPVVQAAGPVLDPILGLISRPELNPVTGNLPPVVTPIGAGSPIGVTAGASPAGTVAPPLASDRAGAIAHSQPTASVPGPWHGWSGTTAPTTPTTAGRTAEPAPDPMPNPVPGPNGPSGVTVPAGSATTAQSSPTMDAVTDSFPVQPAAGGRQAGRTTVVAPRDQAFSPAVSPD